MEIDLIKHGILEEWFASIKGHRYVQQQHFQHLEHLQNKHGTLLAPHCSMLEGWSCLEGFTRSYFNLSDLSKPLNFLEGSFDVILLPHVLEFCSEPELIWQEILRLMRPDGMVIVSGFVPSFYFPLLSLMGNRQDKAIRHLPIFHKKTLKKSAAGANLVCYEMNAIGSGVSYLPLTIGFMALFKLSEQLVRPLKVESLITPLTSGLVLPLPSSALRSQDESI